MTGGRSVVMVVQALGADVVTIQRCRQLCRDRFSSEVAVAQPHSVSNNASATLHWPECAADGWNAVVFVLESNATPVALVSARMATDHVYSIELVKGQRLRIRKFSGEPDYDQSLAHVFNRVSATKEKGYIYFPYGYLYRMAGHGPLDEFGFRIDADLPALASRPENHKLIVTFGGSTTWSIDCLPSETYTNRLEVLLNEDARANGHDMRYTCLNFGQVSYTVLSEMMTFILFAWEARPDIVIAHDGWNDLLYGSYTDPYLVKERNIVYPCDLEPWGQLLHDGHAAQTTKSGPKPYPFRSAPSHVLHAYFTRKEQFRRIAEAAGCTFIWGLQPCIYDKCEHTQEELAVLDPDGSINQDDWKDIRKRVPELLRQVAAASGGVPNFVDVGSAFARLSGTVQHFSDTIHLTPDGDAAVAQAYKDYIAGMISGE